VHVWQYVSLWNEINDEVQQHYNIEKVIFLLMQPFHVFQSEHFTIELWSLWKSINMKLWPHFDEMSNHIKECVISLLED